VCVRVCVQTFPLNVSNWIRRGIFSLPGHRFLAVYRDFKAIRLLTRALLIKFTVLTDSCLSAVARMFTMNMRALGLSEQICVKFLLKQAKQANLADGE